MEKVKVSKEMGLALERVFEAGLKSALGREGYLIYNYINNSYSSENKILRQLSLKEITKLSFEGYEVEKTPEEIFLEEYDILKRIAEKSENLIKVEKAKDAIFTINKTLEVLEIKIKGVNC